MKTNAFLVVLCFLASTITFAQKSFSGYYITKQNDTVNVSFPNYSQWNYTPKKVKAVQVDKVTLELTPANCKSFTVTGYDTYESKEFTRLVNPTDINSTNDFFTSADSIENMNAFLLLLTESNGYKLYKYTDKTRENYFLQETKTSVIHLKWLF